MKKYRCRYLFCISFLTCSMTLAEPIKSSYQWSGFYLGATAGGIFSQFDTKTSTQTGPLLDSAQANAVNNAGQQQINTFGFISGIEGGYNWQRDRLLVGLEADIQSLSINNETNSNAILYPNQPDRQFVITSYGNNNWLMTIRPRIGLAVNNWLFYLTGGLALGLIQSDFVFSTNEGDFESKRVSKVKVGYDIGAGIETGLSKHISVKAEYQFVNFGDTNASNMNNHVPAGQTFSNSVNLKSNIIRIGVNYHFDEQSSLVPPGLQLGIFDNDVWQTEIGTRLFLSTGIDGAPQPLLSSPGMPLISRLIFSDLSAISGEVFARADHISGLFVKGYLGAGSITNGQLNDEDFPAGGAYSNTFSNALGNLSYATFDVGYSFLKTPSAKTGAFVGYNYYAQNINIYSCEQQAGAGICVPSGDLSKFIALSEEDEFNSLRLGFTSQFNLTRHLTLTSEAAYLPVVSFKGTDMHNARQLIGPERADYGNGAMLESVLDYQFMPSWWLGLGGRYWMWNMPRGSVTFDFLGESGSFNQPARFMTERYGVFLQLSYRDGQSNFIENVPVSWKGIFVGGELGGAWGKSNWSDPFGETPGTDGAINKAGFGDNIRSTGPLAGIDLNINWQKNQWVYGVGGSISAADIRGENTLFSGTGGVNGQTIVNYLGTIVGRVGIASNSALYYINGGRAVLNTKYFINGNTAVLTLGTQSQTVNTWGWTGGVGVEYALTDHWTSNVEYDYVSLPSRNLSFNAVLNNNNIAANQTLNIFKLGLNYRFDVLV